MDHNDDVPRVEGASMRPLLEIISAMSTEGLTAYLAFMVGQHRANEYPARLARDELRKREEQHDAGTDHPDAGRPQARGEGEDRGRGQDGS